MNEEWSEWFEHDGKGCPCVGQWVQGINLRGRMAEGLAGVAGGVGWSWHLPHPRISVIRYRVRKPRGMQILDAILRDLPVTPERIDA